MWPVKVLVVGCAALALCLGTTAAAADPTAWTGYGDGPERDGVASPAADGTTPNRDFVLPLEGRIVGQVLESGGTFYAATTAGEVAAFTADGIVRWRDEVGQL